MIAAKKRCVGNDMTITAMNQVVKQLCWYTGLITGKVGKLIFLASSLYAVGFVT